MLRILLLVASAMAFVGPLVAAASSEDPDLQKVDEPRAIVKAVLPDEGESVYLNGLISAPSGGFVHGFVATFSVIVVSELGDKTFFIAAIMAMRHPRLVVLGGAIAALAIMHVMSALFGAFALMLVPKTFTLYISSLLFAVFGIKMLKEGYEMSANEGQEEMEEVQEELRKKDLGEATEDVEGGEGRSSSIVKRLHRLISLVFSQIFIQAFTMTFLAEWGDRSQLATIILASRENTLAVIISGILGHFLCTSLAVIGGRIIAQRISVRTVTVLGGVVFILFATTVFFVDTSSE